MTDPIRAKAEEEARRIIANLYGWSCKLISIPDQEADYAFIAGALEPLMQKIDELEDMSYFYKAEQEHAKDKIEELEKHINKLMEKHDI